MRILLLISNDNRDMNNEIACQLANRWVVGPAFWRASSSLPVKTLCLIAMPIVAWLPTGTESGMCGGYLSWILQANPPQSSTDTILRFMLPQRIIAARMFELALAAQKWRVDFVLALHVIHNNASHVPSARSNTVVHPLIN